MKALYKSMNYYDRLTSLLLAEAKASAEAVERAKKHQAARRKAEGPNRDPINAGDDLPPPRIETKRSNPIERRHPAHMHSRSKKVERDTIIGKI